MAGGHSGAGRNPGHRSWPWQHFLHLLPLSEPQGPGQTQGTPTLDTEWASGSSAKVPFQLKDKALQNSPLQWSYSRPHSKSQKARMPRTCSPSPGRWKGRTEVGFIGTEVSQWTVAAAHPSFRRLQQTALSLLEAGSTSPTAPPSVPRERPEVGIFSTFPGLGRGKGLAQGHPESRKGNRRGGAQVSKLPLKAPEESADTLLTGAKPQVGAMSEVQGSPNPAGGSPHSFLGWPRRGGCKERGVRTMGASASRAGGSGSEG